MAPTNGHSCLLNALWIVAFLTTAVELSSASHDVIPHPCDAVKCPPLSEITCPEDSDVRETEHPIALLHTATALTPTTEEGGYNTSEIAEDLYAQCCLIKKCICRTCYIPDCHAHGDVVVELLPEAMDTPGQCCGQYECHREPNCTEVRDTENYWLTDCQRCKCYSGERICQQSCDEGMKKPTAICNSKNLNIFFTHGDTWKDGCSECECVNGEEKCVMPFCRSVDCPPYRQVILKDSCCPICWPKGIAMPNGDEDYDENADDDNAEESGNHHNYRDELVGDEDEDGDTVDDFGNEINTLPHLDFGKDLNASTTERILSSKSSIAAATTASPFLTETTGKQFATMVTANEDSHTPTVDAPAASILDGISSTQAPCKLDARREPPATYQVYPEVVEVVRQTHQNDLLYAIIGCLALVVIVLTAWNIHLRAKQRSYRPVSNFDDNFNKMSSNIKKMNDYV